MSTATDTARAGFWHAWGRLQSALRHVAEARLPEILCVLNAAVAIYYGATSQYEAAKIIGAPIFGPAMRFAYLHLWVGAWLVLGACVLIAGFLWRGGAVAANYALALVWAMWAVKLGEAQAAGIGLLNAPGTYSGLAFLAVVAGIACTIPPPRRRP